ncbi:hypothetical protein FHG64_11890 [Antarcticibacterium flavum]|uniref:Uncharacterized protein n=1 Tax=Antarcticibacterium flavum TaxID=2058175 RepID=A0A5B7X5Q4_9FLAO|nr:MULTISPECIES: hypothetical protein [Antarcticibacterium]MCM4158275.1 hypothetical protein [Antarcticibacterium sp. W02-3]QCY70042.1 hypothetical protein FHG64_11890 [Antarcticibacterium flavum]
MVIRKKSREISVLSSVFIPGKNPIPINRGHTHRYNTSNDKKFRFEPELFEKTKDRIPPYHKLTL